MNVSVSSVLISLALATPAVAAVSDTKTATVQRDLVMETKAQSKRKLAAADIRGESVTKAPQARATSSGFRTTPELMAYYSAADKFQTSFRSNGIGASATLNSGPGYGIGVRWMDVKEKQASYAIGVMYEFNRGFDTSTTVVGNTSFDSHYNNVDRPELAIIILEGSATYGLSPKSYLIGGLNYSNPLESGFDDKDLTPALGVQGGAGVHVDNRVNVEAMYRAVNFNMSGGTNFDSDYNHLYGFVLRASYSVQ